MNVKFGCAPINWTNDDLPSLGAELTYEQCISEMALAGFQGTEVGHKYPKDVPTLKKALDLRGLVVCNMWYSSYFTAFRNAETLAGFQDHLAFSYALGARVVTVGEIGVSVHIQPETPLFTNLPKLSDAQFENLANGLNTLGRMAKAHDMTLCFHPHTGTGIETEADIDRLMGMTDPELVTLLLDTGHITVCGGDPVAVLKKYINRITHMHFKDVRGDILQALKASTTESFIDGVKCGLYTVPGDGNMVDWKSIFDVIKASDYSGWIVVEAEQDPAKANPLEYALKARKFLREGLGV